MEVDQARSKIYWKGTKMRGLGKHEGEIAIQKGFLIFQNNRLNGGEITVDMREIAVTDIPITDPIPIKNLTVHLKSPDFFDVEKYPLSHLKILSIQKSEEENLLVNGSLTIKGITNPITFEVEKVGISHFTTTLELDRFEWNIAYSGSWVDRTLVDRGIILKIELLYVYPVNCTYVF